MECNQAAFPLNLVQALFFILKCTELIPTSKI